MGNKKYDWDKLTIRSTHDLLNNGENPESKHADLLMSRKKKCIVVPVLNQDYL